MLASWSSIARYSPAAARDIEDTLLAGQLALVVAALFTGAAFYINFAEQPARLELEPRAFLIQWRHAYARGYAMQASLVVAGTLLAVLAWWQMASLLWLVGAGILFFNYPFTLLVIMPVNNALKAIDPGKAPPESRAALRRWATLHAVRTALGAASTLVFLVASVR